VVKTVLAALDRSIAVKPVLTAARALASILNTEVSGSACGCESHNHAA
jgi:hypothetical protein